MTLDNLRNQIDEIDLEIKKLFLKRMDVACKVAESKIETGDKILKPKREEEVINNLTNGIAENLKEPYTAFLKKIMEISRTYQYKRLLELGYDFRINYSKDITKKTKVYYQGLPASYSEMATSKIYPQIPSLPAETFEDVFEKISSKICDAGVLPIENTTAGGIYEVYDLLVKYDLYINESYIYKVNHCLAGYEGSELFDIKNVISHPQAIAQCREFLRENNIKTMPCSNTAVAAKEISEKRDITTAAICSREAAEKYNLKILKEEINHNKENATKFVGISDTLIVKEEHDRVAVVFSCPHRSGSLASALGIFGDYGVNLTEIHSRPDGKKSWEYLFYVDFAGNLMDEKIRALIFQLSEEMPFMKILGSYKGGLYGN